MSCEVKEGLLIDLGSDSDSAALSDVSSARSRVSSILWSSTKRLEDDDDPFGLLTTPTASKKAGKVPECELGMLIKISDEKPAETAAISPPTSSRSGWSRSGDVSLSDKKSENLLDKTADSTDWQKLQLEAEAIASTMKSAKKSGPDKKLDLGQFSPLNDSPLAIKDDPVKTLHFDFDEEFIRKKLSPETLFLDEDSDRESDGIFLDDQLEKAIRKSLDGLKISGETLPKKPVAAVVPSVKRKPLVPVPRNRAHGGVPLPPPKKGHQPVVPVSKGFSTPKAPRPMVRRSLAPTGPDTPRPTTFVAPGQPLKQRRSLIPGPGAKPQIYSSTPKVSSTPNKSSSISTSRRSMVTPKSFASTTPISSVKKPASCVPKYSSSSSSTRDENRAKPGGGLRRPSMSFRNPIKN